MATDAKQYNSYAEVKARLDEIVEAVKDENLPLDDALDLYEEAVSLGLRVSDMLEDDIEDEKDSEGEGADLSEEAAESVETNAADQAVGVSKAADQEANAAESVEANAALSE